MPRRANVRPDEAGLGRVLDAGLRLFGERGYEATSIADIGEAAGIAKSVLYHYFDSKAALYTAILEAQTDDLVARVASAIPPGNGPRLRPAVDAYLGFLAQRPEAWRLLLREPPADPDLADIHRRLAAERAAGLGELLATADKRAQDPAHVELVSTAIRTFATWWYDHRDVPRERVVEAVMDMAEAGARRL
jgi:AcrR family transcriptional regulator